MNIYLFNPTLTIFFVHFSSVSLSGNAKSSRSALDLSCTYSERSQVKVVRWSYVQDPSRLLQSAAVLGRITTSVALPVTNETAGLYACTLCLQNGNYIQYMHTVTMANIGERKMCMCFSLSLSGTLLLKVSTLSFKNLKINRMQVNIYSKELFLLRVIGLLCFIEFS